MHQFISLFLWDSKAPRLGLSLLEQFTCFIYRSSHIHTFTDWLHSPELLWCRLEIQSRSSFSSPASLIYSPSPIRARFIKQSKTVSECIHQIVLTGVVSFTCDLEKYKKTPKTVNFVLDLNILLPIFCTLTPRNTDATQSVAKIPLTHHLRIRSQFEVSF